MTNLNDQVRDIVRAALAENGWVIGSLRLAMSKHSKEQLEHYYHANSQALFEKAMNDALIDRLSPFPSNAPSIVPESIGFIWGIPVFVDESLKGDEFKIVSKVDK